MKKCIIGTVLVFSAFSAIGQSSLPQTVNSGPYVFEKQWVDEFTQKESRWDYADWTFDANECEFDSRAATFSNGKLNLGISTKTAGDMGDYPAKPYWAAEYLTTQEFHYGRFVINMKPNTPSGTVTSFFTSHIDWNNDYTIPLEWYEIDIEFAGKTNEVEFTLHWIDNTGKHQDSHVVPLGFDASAAYHEWAVEWTPTFIKYYVDNQLLFTFDDPALLAEQNHGQTIQLNYWVSNAEGWVGAFNPANNPIVTSYDYLGYYSLTNPTTAVLNETKDAFSIYPNPAQGFVQIEGADFQKADYRILETNGVLLDSGKTENGKIIIPESLPKGTYILELSNGTKTGRKLMSF